MLLVILTSCKKEDQTCTCQLLITTTVQEPDQVIPAPPGTGNPPTTIPGKKKTVVISYEDKTIFHDASKRQAKQNCLNKQGSNSVFGTYEYKDCKLE